MSKKDINKLSDADLLLLINNPETFFLLQHPDSYMANLEAERKHKIYLMLISIVIILIMFSGLFIATQIKPTTKYLKQNENKKPK